MLRATMFAPYRHTKLSSLGPDDDPDSFDYRIGLFDRPV
jgi:hypothetical protein